jgi:hypothetical protein
MVAVIKTSRSIKAAVHYNEKKIELGTAECLMAANYPCDAPQMTAGHRLNMLLKIAAMNQNVKTNSIHITLNFHPSEKLPKTSLTAIAESYMRQIGFDQQPYLVYQHHDAAHPHLHIVSSIVRHNGERIDILNIGRNQSEKARKQIEQSFGLLTAQGSTHKINQQHAQRVEYGKDQTVAAIASVLDAILPVYRYTSLSELNALLRQYNITADQGTENSQTYKKRGLVYRILDSYGNRTGAPVKASILPGKPTLKYLEKRFEINRQARLAHVPRLRSMVDLKLLRVSDGSLRSFTSSLEKEAIKTVVRQNKQAQITGIIFVDFKTKSVFDSNDLGHQYTVSAILERCTGNTVQVHSRQHIPSHHKGYGHHYNRTRNASAGRPDPVSLNNPADAINADENLDLLFAPVRENSYLPWQLRKTRKRKQKKLSQQL